MSRLLILALLGGSWVLFVAAVVWPASALIARCLAEGPHLDAGAAFSSRQLGLLWRSVWLSAVAAVACVCVSFPGAYAIGRLRRLSASPLVVAVLTVALLSPPTVYAFGWERILPATFNSMVRCVGIWSLWAWPIPALIIGAGWSRVGHGAHEAALLVLPTWSAFVRVSLPILFRYVSLSALLVFVLFFGDYGVPHACGLLVYSTELLGWAQESNRAIHAVSASAPAVAVSILAVGALMVGWNKCAFEEGDSLTSSAAARGWKPSALVLAWFSVTWVVPVAALVGVIKTPGVIVEAVQVYGADLAWSVGLATLAGVLVVGMGLGVLAVPGVRTPVLLASLVGAVFPGALVGRSLVAAYNLDAFGWVYDHWPIVVLSYVARFAWVGMVTGLVVLKQTAPALVAQARVDGAPSGSILTHIQWALHWPTIAAGIGVAAALSLAEVPTSAMVRIPAFGLIAHILIEKFHRFEDGMLASLSLWLCAAALPAGLCAAVILGRRRATSP